MEDHISNGCIKNIDKWRFYCDGLISPDSFINFGFYYLIGAALQRRVWVGPKHKPLFGNTYVTFVSEPGVGKGLVITEIAKFIKYHKLQSPHERTITVHGDETGRVKSIEKDGNVLTVDREMAEAAAKADYMSGLTEEERAGILGAKHSNVERPLLFPVAADATSYEALVSSMSRALRRKNYIEFDPITSKNITKIYTHSSMCFCLEEISSLFRKKAEDVANFLQIAYDCGDYKKDTKTQGVDRIHKCCLSFLGGTQPNFMRRAFGDGLLNEGFASRSWFIFESRNRKVRLNIPELNEIQQQYEQDILDHIKKLSNLYGAVSYTPEAFQFLEEWWIRAQTIRPNLSEKLLHYYSRKNIHVQKLAMAIHFADSLDMTIGIDSCKQALRLLASIERRMDHALISKSENPYYHLGLKVLKFLSEVGKKTFNELLARFWEDCNSPGNPKEALEKVLEHYQVMGKITIVRDNNVIYYEIIMKEDQDEY